MKIAIIGAGVAGLSAGCYLQMNGFETEIFEMHSKSGGLCTNWKRGDYTFNGCIHWLLGSNKSSPFYKLWSELLDMSSIQFVTNDVRFEIETLKTSDKYGNKVFHLYTNIARLEDYLNDIAPEDKPRINAFIGQIRRIQKFEIPPMIESVPQLLPWGEKIKFIKHLPLLLFLNSYRKITNFSFARKLKNPFLKEAFQLLFDGANLPLLIHTIPLAFQDLKGAGYPIGGSTGFEIKIEEKYKSLGGIINFNSRVEKILTKNDTAVGLKLEDGKMVSFDFVISAADWHFTIFDALEGKYVNKKILALGNLEKLKIYYSIFFVFLGIDRTLDEFPSFLRFPLENPLFSPDGTKYERIEMHIHNYDTTLAPAGKTVVSVSLYTQNGNYWIRLRESNQETYRNVKNDLAQKVIDILEKKVEGIRKNIEQMDIATPATFQRYTNNWEGSMKWSQKTGQQLKVKK
jgi:phytoene dehydrogenase-like protein